MICHSYIFFISLLPFYFCCTGILFAGGPEPERLYTHVIQQGIRQSIEQNYSQAIKTFNRIKTEFPKEPAGYFFKAAAVQTQMMDFERYEQEYLFKALLDTTIILAKTKLKKDKTDAWAHFYLGSAYGYFALNKAKQDKLLEAFQYTRYSVNALEKSIKLDSTLYDAYLGIGMFKYYKGQFSKYLSWMPFVSDERETGIAMIRKAMTKSRFSKDSALNSLCWILIEEKKYDETASLLDRAMSEFPDTRLFWWAAAKLSREQRNWEDAISFYKKILISFEEEKMSSPYNELGCYQGLSEIYAELEDFENASLACEKIESIHFTKEQKRSYSKKVKKAEKHCGRIQSLSEASN